MMKTSIPSHCGFEGVMQLSRAARRMWAVVRMKDVVVEFILDRAAAGDNNPEERPMDNLLLPLSALATWAACAVRLAP